MSLEIIKRFKKWGPVVDELRVHALNNNLSGINAIINPLSQELYMELWSVMRHDSKLRSKIKLLRSGVVPEADQPDPDYIDPLPLEGE